MALHTPGRADLTHSKAVRLHLRTRATRKVERAERIATLLLCDLSNDAARRETRLSVEQYRRARSWLRAASVDARLSPDRLTVHDALRRHADRQVEAALRVGLLHEAGVSREDTITRLGVTRDQYEVAWEWYRDAVADSEP